MSLLNMIETSGRKGFGIFIALTDIYKLTAIEHTSIVYSYLSITMFLKYTVFSTPMQY